MQDDEKLAYFQGLAQLPEPERREARDRAVQWFEDLPENTQIALLYLMKLEERLDRYSVGGISVTLEDYCLREMGLFKKDPEREKKLIDKYNAYIEKAFEEDMQLFPLLPPKAQITIAAIIADINDGMYKEDSYPVSKRDGSVKIIIPVSDERIEETFPTRTIIQAEFDRGRDINEIVVTAIDTFNGMSKGEKEQAHKIIDRVASFSLDDGVDIYMKALERFHAMAPKQQRQVARDIFALEAIEIPDEFDSSELTNKVGFRLIHMYNDGELLKLYTAIKIIEDAAISKQTAGVSTTQQLPPHNISDCTVQEGGPVVGPTPSSPF